MFFNVVMALAAVSEAIAESDFIPGVGCGTYNTIKILYGSPTLQEEMQGCIYIEKGLSNKFRGMNQPCYVLHACTGNADHGRLQAHV